MLKSAWPIRHQSPSHSPHPWHAKKRQSPSPSCSTSCTSCCCCCCLIDTTTLLSAIHQYARWHASSLPTSTLSAPTSQPSAIIHAPLQIKHLPSAARDRPALLRRHARYSTLLKSPAPLHQPSFGVRKQEKKKPSLAHPRLFWR
jgi:hypothetical protein